MSLTSIELQITIPKKQEEYQAEGKKNTKHPYKGSVVDFTD